MAMRQPVRHASILRPNKFGDPRGRLTSLTDPYLTYDQFPNDKFTERFAPERRTKISNFPIADQRVKWSPMSVLWRKTRRPTSFWPSFEGSR